MSQLSPGLVTASQGFAPSHNKSVLVFLALMLTCETPSEDWTGRGCGEQPLVTRSQEKAATLTYNQTLIPGSDWSDWAWGGLSLVSSRTWKSVTDQTCRQLVTITNINSQFHQKPISRCQLSEADQGKSVQNVEETKFMVKVWLMWLHIVLMNELTDHRALMQLSNVPPPQYNVRLLV